MENERCLPVQVGGRLFGILQSSATARKYMQSIMEYTPKPFLEPLSAVLPDARSAQINEVQVGPSHNARMAYSTCGQYIAVCARYELVAIEVSTFKVLSRFRVQTGAVWGLCFLPHSTKVVSGSVDTTVKIWDIHRAEGDVITLEGHTDCVHGVCGSRDGARIASASEDCTVRLWDVQSAGRECKVLKGHKSAVLSVCFSPDDSLLASGCEDGEIRIWDGCTGDAKGITPIQDKVGIQCMAFSPDGALLASNSKDNAIVLWSTSTWTRVGIVLKGHSFAPFSISFSHDGTRIMSASYDMVRLWDVRTYASTGFALQGQRSRAQYAALSPDDAHVAVSFSDGTVRLWDVAKADMGSMEREQLSDEVWTFSFSADGARAAQGYHCGKIRVLDVWRGAELCKVVDAHSGPVGYVELSRDGSLLASASGRTVRVWDTATGAPASDLLELSSDGHVRDLALSADGAIVAISDFGSIKLWHWRSGTAAVSSVVHEPQFAYRVTFSEDAKKLVSSYPHIWDVHSGKLLWTSDQSAQTKVHHLSDTEAQRIMDECESYSRPKIDSQGLVPYCKKGFQTKSVVMDTESGEICLMTLPFALRKEWSKPYAFLREDNLFATYFSGRQHDIFRLHM